MQEELSRVWENSPGELESVSKEMEGEERGVGREGMRDRDLKREEREKSIRPETLKECRGAGAEGVAVEGAVRPAGLGRERGGTAWAGEL